MIVAVPKETAVGERRVALTPDTIKRMARDGVEVRVEPGAGLEAGFRDSDYEQAGAKLEASGASLWSDADVVVKVQPPQALESGHEVDLLRQGSVVVGFMRPLDEPALAERLAKKGASTFALELLPRITRAQSMDALSSQNTVIGYRSVLLAAEAVPKFFPMLVTAAGTISPAKVLIIGAGVAGLQAIATARRLGALVEAYDTRPAVKEQVESLGARFVELDLDTGDAEDAGGYAKAQSEDFYQRQRDQLGARVRACDVVITTALVPGQPAPLLIEESSVREMKPGSVIVDLAAEKGGNCQVSKPDTAVNFEGVTVFGPTNLASAIPYDASQLYGRNLQTLLKHLTAEDGSVQIDLEDELTRGTLLTHGGEIMNDRVKALVDGGGA